MKYFQYIIPLFLIMACSSGPEVEDDSLLDNEVVEQLQRPDSALDRYEQRMVNVDDHIADLEHTGGFTGKYVKQGSTIQFVELFAYFIDGEFVKLESYYFASKLKKSERFYFMDKRLMRYDLFESKPDAQSGEKMVREERHYFDSSEKLIRSAYREIPAKKTNDLEGLEMKPMVEYDREVVQRIISEKMIKYTSEMNAAEEIDLNGEDLKWPFRKQDMSAIKEQIIKENRERSE